MPDRSRKRPRDLNSLAASIVSDATDETYESKPDDGKDPAAVALGRKGGLKGGKARAEKAHSGAAVCGGQEGRRRQVATLNHHRAVGVQTYLA
jgi:hypothetical protein